jgi:CRISPR-associated protein Csb2
MLALAWEYLTGRAVAASYGDREHAEWPPHPDRVFQALVAAWGERGCDGDERAALEWLERAGPPLVAAPSNVETVETHKVFVPTNDIEGRRRGAYGDKELELLPAYRVRKDRRFPATVVGDATCALIWANASVGEHRAALERVANSVTYLGHSTALVRAWLDDSPPAPDWQPASTEGTAEVQLRVPEPGRLEVL